VSPDSVVADAPKRYSSPGWTAARFARYLERVLSPLEITLAQYRMMVMLEEGAGSSTALARKLAVSPPSVTTVVDGLVQRGAIERTPSQQDRRQISLALTDIGRELLARAEVVVSAQFAAIADSLGDPTAARAALDAMTLWSEALDRHFAAQLSARGETVPGND
jgi:DNA-binding MarR family transcriptional regulator